MDALIGTQAFAVKRLRALPPLAIAMLLAALLACVSSTITGRRHMRGVGLWLALVMVAWLPPVDANSRDVFAWRDAGGITHFSDRPGAPSAERVETRAGSMSIVESKAPRANPLRALVEREIRWQQSHRQQQQREVLAEMAKKKTYCDRLQAQKDEADSKRQRSRLLALEDQWFAKCR